MWVEGWSFVSILVCIFLHHASCKMQNAKCGANWIIFFYFAFSCPKTRKLQNASYRTINKLAIFFLIPHSTKLILTILFLFTLIWRSVLFIRNYKYDIFDLWFFIVFTAIILSAVWFLPPYFTTRLQQWLLQFQVG